MIIRTIHHAIILNSKEYRFQMVGEHKGKFGEDMWEGEVPDDVGRDLISRLRRPNEFMDVTPKPEPKVEASKKAEK